MSIFKDYHCKIWLFTTLDNLINENVSTTKLDGGIFSKSVLATSLTNLAIPVTDGLLVNLEEEAFGRYLDASFAFKWLKITEIGE